MSGDATTYRLTGCDVVFPDGAVAPGVIDVRNGAIDGVYRDVDAPATDVPTIDLTGHTVAPGFIDIHINGAGGATFDSGTPEAMSTILGTCARYGTTAVLGALNTAPDEERIAALERLQAWAPGEGDRVDFLGVYLEGPYYHPLERGAHPAEWMHDPDPDEYGVWLDRFGDLIRVFSLAPELRGAVELIEAVVQRGIVAAVGHSAADEAEMDRAVDAGLSLVTHIYSAQSAFHRDGPVKHLGVAEMALLRDELTVEVISDGHHLPPRLLDLVLKLKPHDRVCVATDAMHAAGLGPGRYNLMGTAVWVDEEVAYRPDRQRYAGSILTMDRAVRQVVQAGVPLGEAVQMATAVPAKTVGLDGCKGRLAQGYDADLVVLDDALEVSATVCRGRVAYAREGSALVGMR